MQFPSSYNSINPCFTAGKISGVGNCHAAWRHQKTIVCITSIVYDPRDVFGEAFLSYIYLFGSNFGTSNLFFFHSSFDSISTFSSFPWRFWNLMIEMNTCCVSSSALIVCYNSIVDYQEDKWKIAVRTWARTRALPREGWLYWPLRYLPSRFRQASLHALIKNCFSRLFHRFNGTWDQVQPNSTGSALFRTRLHSDENGGGPSRPILYNRHKGRCSMSSNNRFLIFWTADESHVWRIGSGKIIFNSLHHTSIYDSDLYLKLKSQNHLNSHMKPGSTCDTVDLFVRIVLIWKQ